MIGLIVSLIVIGLIAGALARLAVPGKQDLTIGQTLLIGIIGSFVGGFIGYLINGNSDDVFQPAGIIGSVVGAIIVLLVYSRVINRSINRPSHRWRH